MFSKHIINYQQNINYAKPILVVKNKEICKLFKIILRNPKFYQILFVLYNAYLKNCIFQRLRNQVGHYFFQFFSCQALF